MKFNVYHIKLYNKNKTIIQYATPCGIIKIGIEGLDVGNGGFYVKTDQPVTAALYPGISHEDELPRIFRPQSILLWAKNFVNTHLQMAIDMWYTYFEYLWGGAVNETRC